MRALPREGMRCVCLKSARSSCPSRQRPRSSPRTRRDTPQFRTGVELIQLDVAVLDGNRQAVRGLSASDFTVVDNGIATPIRAFTPVVLAGSTRATEAVWSHDVAPDTATNQVGEQEGRLVIILLDRSIPAQQPTVTARRDRHRRRRVARTVRPRGGDHHEQWRSSEPHGRSRATAPRDQLWRSEHGHFAGAGNHHGKTGSAPGSALLLRVVCARDNHARGGSRGGHAAPAQDAAVHRQQPDLAGKPADLAGRRRRRMRRTSQRCARDDVCGGGSRAT